MEMVASTAMWALFSWLNLHRGLKSYSFFKTKIKRV